jgi:BTB/POZ domain
MALGVYEFDSPDADLILVSNTSEGAAFHVHKFILATASPFFQDMLSLPQPRSECCAQDKLPLIHIPESRDTIDALLRFVYPVPNPCISTLDELVPVLGAAVKYDFEVVISTLRKLLLSPHFLLTSPTRVFAIACRFDLEDEARLASQYTLRVNVLDCPLSEDLKHITAYSYHRLLDLHRRRAQAAQELLKLSDDVKCMQCNGSSYGIFMPPKWWVEFEKRAKEELRVRPTTDVIFDLEFLGQTASAAGCTRCPQSMFDSYKFLEQLKRQINELPATI